MQSNLSVTAKMKAIEAKLKMMAQNCDVKYPAAPVYSYFKPPDKKRLPLILEQRGNLEDDGC